MTSLTEKAIPFPIVLNNIVQSSNELWLDLLSVAYILPLQLAHFSTRPFPDSILIRERQCTQWHERNASAAGSYFPSSNAIGLHIRCMKQWYKLTRLLSDIRRTDPSLMQPRFAYHHHDGQSCWNNLSFPEAVPYLCLRGCFPHASLADT